MSWLLECAGAASRSGASSAAALGRHQIEVDAPADAIDASNVGRLPDDPAIVAGATTKAPFPRGSVERVEDAVPRVELVLDVEQDTPTSRCFDDVEERPELPLQLILRWTVRTVPWELEVDRRREICFVDRRDAQEVRRLVLTGSAQREEVVFADVVDARPRPRH